MRHFIVRLLINSAAAALIVVRATNLTPDPAAVLPLSTALRAANIVVPSAVELCPLVSATAQPGTIDHCFAADPDLNTRSAEMGTVVAALSQDWDLVRRLLDSGAPMEITDGNGITPLMAAAMQGNVPMLRTLLERHARADLVDADGKSALHYAIATGKLEAIETLLPVIPNLQAISAAGRDLLATAFESGDVRIFRSVLERFPSALAWTSTTRRALEGALNAGLKDQVRLLLSKHISPPTPEGRNVPLIAYAIAKDDAALFQTLLACGSDPNAVLPKNCDKEFISLLTSKSVSNYLEEEGGVNLLMLAAGLGRTDYVRALLDAGADRNRTTPRDKMLPLYFAARSANWQCVQMLLGGGPLPDQLRIEISLASQQAVLIKDGVTIFTTECSTGREGFGTPAGHYVITDKDRDHRSTIYKVAMPYFMRLNCRDFGMHEGVVPKNHPASHGCIRLPGAAARRLFAEIPVGTVVMIN